ncbi:MAG: nicotinate-nucleotide adenylyltransferase [Muricomes sp.]
MVETGVIHGRFQIFHLKHMEYLLAAKMRCKKLYIGITHSDIVSFAATSPLDLHGVTRRDNPLTYFERFEMIQGALAEFGVKREEYEIIPFPVSQPDLILQYAPKDAVYFMSICGEWDEERYEMLQNLGLNVEILWRKNKEEVGVTGTEVRNLIAEEKDWQQYVPKSVNEYIAEHEIEQRIKNLNYLFE